MGKGPCHELLEGAELVYGVGRIELVPVGLFIAAHDAADRGCFAHTHNAHTYAHTHTHTHPRTHSHTRTCAHAHTRTRARARARTHAQSTCTNACTVQNPRGEERVKLNGYRKAQEEGREEAGRREVSVVCAHASLLMSA